MKRFSRVFLSALAVSLPVMPVAGARAEGPSAAAVMKTYGDIAEATYGDAAAAARKLEQAVDAFLAKPSAETLATARDAWKASRVPYMQSEAFRFGNKIVDDWEGEVNSWPLDEGLIDYVDKGRYGEQSDTNPLYTANIIATPKLKLGNETLDATKITKKVIAKLNSAMEVEANVGTGYHAVEFLLWGQDLNGTGPGAGNRPATDFDLKACSNGNCDRRRDNLKAATGLLVDDLNTMAADWKVGGAARKALAKMTEPQQLAVILTGLGSLSYGELAGERMKLGVILHDTEEEHDCFSDNTQNSHYYDEVGMMNVWNGGYNGTKQISGTSIRAYVHANAPEAAKRLDDAMAVAEGKLKAIKDKADSGGMAYDQMLASGNDEGNKLILGGVEALVAQARAVEAVVAALKLTVKIEGSDSLDNPGAVTAK